jgi:hypothetical protein
LHFQSAAPRAAAREGRNLFVEEIGVVETTVPAELADLIERVAHHHRGLALLHEAYLETAAIVFKVHPFVIDAARAYLATDAGRRAMIDEVKQAQERGGAGVAAEPVPPPCAPGPEPCREAEDLLERARAHPQGLRSLIAAPPESIAAVFGVHPYIVFRALGVLERQGILPAGARDGS